MNKHGRDDHGQQDKKQYAYDTTETNKLEKRISHVLHAQAERISFKPELRTQILSQLPTSRQHHQKRVAWTIMTAAAVFVILSAILLPYLSTSSTPSIRYTITKEMNVAPVLASGGQLLSLDPTEHHIVYQPANQVGVLYMANIANPIQSNTLVMRNEQTMAWAPDGSALVATISSIQTAQTLLALVPQGQYMHLLGPEAQAANWSPTNNNAIMYVQQAKQKMQLWSIEKSGAAATLQWQMQTSLHAQQMIWSADGYHLALIVTEPFSETNKASTQPNRAIYMVNTRNGKFTQLVAPGNFTIGTVGWSPDGQKLAYEQISPSNNIALKTLTITGQTKPVSITPQHQLIGWSWAPDSTALVYSDNGVLKSHTFAGDTHTFPATSGTLDSPFWLKNGQILCMSISNGRGQLAILTPQK